MAKKKPQTPKMPSRLQAALYVVAEMKKPMRFDALAKACDARYEQLGGNVNQKGLGYGRASFRMRSPDYSCLL